MLSPSSLSAEQLADRAVALGGSDCAAALGLSRWKTARQLYHEKRGELPPDEPEEEFAWWGIMLEPIVRQRYAEETGNVVRLPTATIWHPTHKFMCAHIDGYVDNCTPRRGYEGKTAFRSTGWGEEGTDQVPIDCLMQTQHYMVVTDLPVFDVCVLINRHFAYYEVPRADAEMQEMIIEGEWDFMRRVREGDPPPLDYTHRTALDVVKKLYPGTNGVRLIANEHVIDVRQKMEQFTQAEKVAKQQKEACKAELLDLMGNAALLAFPDGKCFRRQQVDRKAYTVDATSYVDFRLVNDGKGIQNLTHYPTGVSK